MPSAFAPSGRTGPVPSAKLRPVSEVVRTVPRLTGHAWPWWSTGRCSGREARSARSLDADDDGVDISEVLAAAGDDADAGGGVVVAIGAKSVPADRAGAVVVDVEMDDGVDRGATLDTVTRGGLLVQPASITAMTAATTNAAFRPGAGTASIYGSVCVSPRPYRALSIAGARASPPRGNLQVDSARRARINKPDVYR